MGALNWRPHDPQIAITGVSLSHLVTLRMRFATNITPSSNQSAMTLIQNFLQPFGATLMRRLRFGEPAPTQQVSAVRFCDLRNFLAQLSNQLCDRLLHRKKHQHVVTAGCEFYRRKLLSALNFRAVLSTVPGKSIFGYRAGDSRSNRFRRCLWRAIF
jgi:hypothetical protein